MELPPHTPSPHERTVIIQDESLRQFEGGFTAVPNRILRNSDLSLGTRMTYGMLLHYAWQDTFCFLAQESLARDLGVTDRSIRTFLKELRDKQLITWRQQGLHKSNIYFLLKLPDAPKPAPLRARPENISGLEWKPTSGQDRQPASAYKDSSTNTHKYVNVNNNRRQEHGTPEAHATADLSPMSDLMAGQEAQLLQRMGTRLASAPSVVELSDPEAQEDYLITDIMTQLGDTNPHSRKTYRTILRTLGKQLTYQLVGNTREAHRDGLVQPHKMAGYFVGTAKQQAATRGLTLTFGPHH